MINLINNKKQIKDLSSLFCSIRNAKELFNTQEWLVSFYEIYNIRDCINVSCNHASIFLVKNNLGDFVYLGDPFNDFNESCNCTEFVGYLKKILKENNNKIFLNNTKIKLSENFNVTNLYKVNLKKIENKISKKILKQYERLGKELKYLKIDNNDKRFNEYLNWLLDQRLDNLHENKTDEWNLSFEVNFNVFIKSFLEKIVGNKKVVIDVLIRSDTKEIMSASLNFYIEDTAMCYLRGCIRDRKYSFGMILDVYIMKNALLDKYKYYDLTRGDEFYKKRLGSEKYIQYNSILDY